MRLDHLAVSGESLEAAQAHVEETLGVKMQAGGEHDVFHTHNALLGLEDGLYLEAIAINPAAPAPERTRWFDLDRFEGPARLSNWICRSEALAQEAKALPEGIGEPVDLQRGDLRWRMLVPQSGILPFDNLFPALIQWQTPKHPAAMLKASGCRLQYLVLTHPQAPELQSLLSPVFKDARIIFETGPVAIRAEIHTPQGRRYL